ncbi:MAG: globin family protein [Pseudomonadota bacterium]
MITMTPETIITIRESWSTIVPTAQVAAENFYSNLFDLDPSLRRLFSTTDMAAQHRLLVEALTAVVANADDLQTIAPTLSRLGARHAQYGVTPRHYDTVGTALLRTLEQGLGSAFRPEVRAAWTVAYAIVAGVMQDGAKDMAAMGAA